jgi:hypothetical protein
MHGEKLLDLHAGRCLEQDHGWQIVCGTRRLRKCQCPLLFKGLHSFQTHWTMAVEA